jgi:hypothetical protein
MKIKMKFPKQYRKATVLTLLVTGSPEEGTRIYPLSASGDSGGSASDSPTTVPRTLYGHKIYLPLADYPKTSDTIHQHTSEHNSRRHYCEQQQQDRSGSSPPSPSAANKDDIEPRRPDVPAPSKDDFGPRLPEVALSGLERLVRCHAIWFLPTVSREEAVSFLHAKEEGVSNFCIFSLMYCSFLFSIGNIKYLSVAEAYVVTQRESVRYCTVYLNQ